MEKVILSIDDCEGTGEVFRKVPSKPELRKKALRAALPFWVLAIPSLFIPLLHYLLVPVFLVIGYLQARPYWKGKAVYVDGKVDCPRCQKHLNFVEMPIEVPLKVLCDSCGYQLRLREKDRIAP